MLSFITFLPNFSIYCWFLIIYGFILMSTAKSLTFLQEQQQQQQYHRFRLHQQSLQHSIRNQGKCTYQKKTFVMMYLENRLKVFGDKKTHTHIHTKKQIMIINSK